MRALGVHSGVDNDLRDLLPYDGAVIVNADNGNIRAIRYKVNPSRRIHGEDQAWTLAGKGTKHNSALYMSEAGFVAMVRSDDGDVTVFTPVSTQKGEGFRVVKA